MSEERKYHIEDIFEDYKEYEQYLLRALSLLKDQDKKRNPTLQKYVPERLEIRFNKSIKAPQYYMPRFEGVIVLELPDNNLSPKKKALIRQMRLDSHLGVIKTNEITCAESLAMRMKVLDQKPKGRKKP